MQRTEPVRRPTPGGMGRRVTMMAGLLALIGAGTFSNPTGGSGHAEGRTGKLPKAAARRRRRNKIARASRTYNRMAAKGKR